MPKHSTRIPWVEMRKRPDLTAQLVWIIAKQNLKHTKHRKHG